MAFTFEDLNVYQRALKLAEGVGALAANFGRGHYHLADRLRRASISICLHIADGSGRWTKPDRSTCFALARGSVFECVPLLELSRRAGLLTMEAQAAMKEELEVLSKMLTGLIKGTDERRDVA